MLFRRMELLVEGKLQACALFSGPYYFAEQLGFRKIIDNTFMIATMITGNPDPEDLRKFFAMLNVITQYSNTYDTIDKALVGVKILIGHCEFVPNPAFGKGIGEALVAIPKSISFARMDQLEFNAFYDKALDGALKYMVPTMDKTSMERAVVEIVGFIG